MSFPRAKIHRFNDIQNGTPSPADYNPKIKSRVTGAVLSTTDRFVEHKSPALSDTASNQSLNSTSYFRTPTLPKKKKVISGIVKTNPANLFAESDTNAEALKDKIVECTNKDVYINELTEQIDDMRIQLSNLKLQKEELENEKRKFEEFTKNIQDEHKIQIDNVVNKQNNEQRALEQQLFDAKVKLELSRKEFDNLKAGHLESGYKDLAEHLKKEYIIEIEKKELQFNNEKGNLLQQIIKIGSEVITTKNEWDKLRVENKKDIEDLLNHINKFQKLNEILIKAYNEEIKTKEEIILKGKNMCSKLENDLGNMKKVHAREIEILLAKHKSEMEDTQYEMLKSITNMQNNLELEKKTIETKYKLDVANLKNIHKEELIKVHNQADAQIKQIEEDCREANLLTEMQMQEKYKDIETTWKIKLDTHIKHSEKVLYDCKELNEFNLTQCKVENQNLKIEFHEKLQETGKSWQLKLEAQTKESDEILKECQAISEYNIIQCELEKNDVQRKLSETLEEFENIQKVQSKVLSEKIDIEKTYNKLKLDYERIIVDLEHTRNELVTLKKAQENATQQAITEKHTFEVTIMKTRKTVEALTKRLFDSDRDVEQLKSELETCEKAKLNIEDKCNKLIDDLHMLTKLNEDLEFQNESALKLSEEKIQTLEKRLISKVDEYKKLIKDSLIKNTITLEKSTKECMLAKEQLHQQQIQLDQQQILNSDAQALIGKVSLELEQYENYNTELEIKVSTLSEELEIALKKVNKVEDTNKELRQLLKDQITENKKLEESIKELHSKNEEVESLMKQMGQLQEKSDSYYQYCEYYKCKANEYEKEIEDMNKINKKYIDQSGKYDELLQMYEAAMAKNKELEITIAQQETLIGPFREQLEAYEMERTALISQKHDAENEAKVMGLKYAQILGHQNQKQKIKHLIDLKRKNSELQESKNETDLKVRTQARTIEKLKKELALLSKNSRKPINSDKENISSPNRALNNSHTSLNNSHISLNNSHLSSPLKDRN